MLITARHTATLFAIALSPALVAMDADLRVVPQVMINNAGFEPGVAMEFRTAGDRTWVLRPELLITDAGDDIGGGLSLLVDVAQPSILPDNSSILVGPRAVHHNEEDFGWDAGAMAMWSMGLGRDLTITHHHIEVIGVIGVVDDRDEDDLDPSLTVGGAYAYRF